MKTRSLHNQMHNDNVTTSEVDRCKIKREGQPKPLAEDNWICAFNVPKLIVSHLIKRFSVFYATRSFNVMFMRDRHRFVSWCTWIRSTTSSSVSAGNILFFFLYSSVCLCSYSFRFRGWNVNPFITSPIHATVQSISAVFPGSGYFLHLTFKYFPQYSVLKQTILCLSLNVTTPNFTAIQITRKIR